MNFLLKNLGWILLFLFFVFMLFIISMSGESKTLPETQINQSNLDILEEKLEEDGISEDNRSEAQDSMDEGKQEEESLFSKLFSRKEDTDSKEVPEEELTHLGSGDEQAFMKNTGDQKDVYISKQAQEYLSESSLYTGLDIETAVGKNYSIGVHSLKLNNKYFNETLGYLTQGDIFTQLSEENYYGCFEVEVTKSQKVSNIGKKGYVCKKWLIEQEESDMKETIVRTEIGQVHSINNDVSLEDGSILEAGDVIDQMSEMNDVGCFTGLILHSESALRIGKVLEVCSTDISQ